MEFAVEEDVLIKATAVRLAQFAYEFTRRSVMLEVGWGTGDFELYEFSPLACHIFRATSIASPRVMNRMKELPQLVDFMFGQRL